MLVRFVFCLVVCISLEYSAIAQNIEKLEKRALKEFYDENLEGALSTYNQILSVNKKHKEALYRAEICSLLTKYRGKSIDKLIRYGSGQGKKDKFYNYWLGRVHYHQNHFTKAIETWTKFLKIKKFKSKIIISETEAFVERAKLAHEQFSHPENYEVEHLHSNVNSKFSEYSPVYFKEKEELLFLSSRAKDTSPSKKGEFMVYHSFRDGNEWASPTPIEKFGHFQERTANIEVVNNEGRLFLYKDTKGGELYYSEFDNNEWGDLVEFDSKIVNSGIESHFFINEDANRVLFTARKKGRDADMDILESFRDPSSGKWEKPIPLSETINSEFDEDFAFLSRDGKTLYFSSKGFGSIGGFDVFKSEFNTTTGAWSAPESLKYPTNTPDDDIQFKLNKDETSGYFVSDRFESKGEFDVYFFHSSDKVQMEGLVLDPEGKPVERAEIHFMPQRSTGLLVKTMTDARGAYKAKVSGNDEITIEISIDHELVFEDKMIMPKVGEYPVAIHRDFKLSTDKKVVQHADFHLEDPKYTEVENIGNKFRHSNRALLSNLYFNFDSNEITNEGSKALLDLVESLKKNEHIRIEIAGHTDSVGDEQVNMTISLSRAQTVKDRLISYGISTTRLVARGYGETKPLASNDDELEGRELNRRTEITVLE